MTGKLTIVDAERDEQKAFRKQMKALKRAAKAQKDANKSFLDFGKYFLTDPEVMQAIYDLAKNTGRNPFDIIGNMTITDIQAIRRDNEFTCGDTYQLLAGINLEVFKHDLKIMKRKTDMKYQYEVIKSNLKSLKCPTSINTRSLVEYAVNMTSPSLGITMIVDMTIRGIRWRWLALKAVPTLPGNGHETAKTDPNHNLR